MLPDRPTKLRKVEKFENVLSLIHTLYSVTRYGLSIFLSVTWTYNKSRAIVLTFKTLVLSLQFLHGAHALTFKKRKHCCFVFTVSYDNFRSAVMWFETSSQYLCRLEWWSRREAQVWVRITGFRQHLFLYWNPSVPQTLSENSFKPCDTLSSLRFDDWLGTRVFS